jgi:hypothetical protein
MADCGFCSSPVFDWEHPYHEKYPEDTLSSYRQKVADVIKGEEYVVLVAEPSTIRTTEIKSYPISQRIRTETKLPIMTAVFGEKA